MVEPVAALPDLPLLAPWYRLVEEPQRVLLEHGGRLVAFEGAAARELLPRLLPLLDGDRSVEEIVEAIGRPAEQAVLTALRVLVDQRLLTEGPQVDAGRELRDTVTHLAADAGVPPATIAGRFAEARVGVAGSSGVAAEVIRLLRRAGVPRVVRRPWSGPGERDDLTVVAPSPEEVPQLEAWNERALRLGNVWLPVLPFDGSLMAIGPLVVPGETACYACYRLRRAAVLGIGVLSEILEPIAVRAGGGPALEVAAAAVVALHSVRWIGTSDARLPGALYALDGTDGLRLTAHRVLRVPRCEACSRINRSAPALPWFQPSQRRDVA